MSSNDIDFFLKVEKKYKLNQIKVWDMSPWTYRRMRLWNYDICVDSYKLHDKTIKAQKHDLKFFFSVIIDFFSMLKNSSVAKKHDVLVLSHNRRVFREGFYECLYTDRIMNNHFDSIFLEGPNEFHHFFPVYSKEILYSDIILIKAHIKSILYKMLMPIKYKKEINRLSQLMYAPISDLKQYYSWSADVRTLAKNLVDTALVCKYEKKYYRNLLKTIDPKLIVEVVYYNRKNMLFNELAKEMNIITIELQHGTMYREHAAYQFDIDYQPDQLPDYIFLFSDYWKKTINMPIDDSHLVVTGFPEFDRNLRADKKSENDDKRLIILFISQGTIGKELAECAVAASSMLDHSKYRIVYKLHPDEYETWKCDLPMLKTPDIEVIDSRKISIYDYFQISSYMVGAYSTAIFEGLGYGLRTFIFPAGHYSIMLPLIEQGYATLVQSPEDLVKEIDNSSGTKQRDRKMFWKENAEENIINQINKLLCL